MNELQMTTRFTIHQGKSDDFIRLARRSMEVTRERDTGTLQYDWFMNADRTQCVLRERYRDSAAVLEHAANLGELMPEFMAVCVPAVEIYGSPSEELLQALAGLAPQVYAAYQSL
ncbi:MAG: antibiotic biosynthesis monooxygenase [Gemmatimonadota bacterium]